MMKTAAIQGLILFLCMGCGHFLWADIVEERINELKSADLKVRLQAASALGNLRDARAVKPLMECLKVQEESFTERMKNEDMDYEVTDALSKLGEPAVKPLIACMKNFHLHYTAAGALSKMGPVAVEPLIACLKGRDEDLCYKAAAVLGKLGDARAVEPLIGCLKGHGEVASSVAAEALGKLGDAKAVEPLIACLRDKERMKLNSDRVIEALGKLGDPRAVEPLIACLKSLYSRSAAAEALGKLGDARAIGPLSAALPDWTAKQAIGSALVKLGWVPKTEREQVYLWICSRENKPHLVAQWEMTKQVLLEDMKSGTPEKIQNAVYTFVSLGNEEVLPNLIRILDAERDPLIANTYLNCGHKGLRLAAEEWCKKHGYSISVGGRGGHAVWGAW